MAHEEDREIAAAFRGKRVAFVGKLGGVTKREALQLVREHGGIPLPRCDDSADVLVVGADVFPLDHEASLLDEGIRASAAEGRLEIIAETQFWQRLGFMECEQSVRRLYTPAMLAELLGVSVATIRRWHRRGLIVPAREVHRLPYFDFQEVATARRLAQLLAAGASPPAIERKLAELSRYVPDVERPLAQLAVIVEGRQILLRQDEGLVEPGGQLRIDFAALERCAGSESQPVTVPTVSVADYLTASAEIPSPDELLQAAILKEDQGELEEALAMYRAVLAARGSCPQVCFQIAELLYRLGDVSAARERYFMAIELDEDFVEARANLGCVFAEMGDLTLAAAAFEGALSHHPDYPDAHYHLARTLDELDNATAAEEHWREFLRLAPDSPWADEARARLGLEA
jgi:tetratricopeptide (TPR) repeat protein